MPTKDSRIISVRVRNSNIDKITEKANSRGWTINKWLSYVIQLGLRSHKKKE